MNSIDTTNNFSPLFTVYSPVDLEYGDFDIAAFRDADSFKSSKKMIFKTLINPFNTNDFLVG